MTLPPLRPMSEADKAGPPVLAMARSGQTFEVNWDKVEELWKGGDRITSRVMRFHGDDLLGWWPMPEVR
jgi:hypothetical protein